MPSWCEQLLHSMLYGCRVLQEKSHGVPSWCEQLLHSMLYDGLLQIVPVTSDASSQQLVSPPDHYKIRRHTIPAAMMPDVRVSRSTSTPSPPP